MISLLINLISVSIAGAIGPGQILFDIFLLRASVRGIIKALSFIV